MRIRSFEPADQNAVIELWKACGLVRPWNDPAKDIARKQTVRPDLFLVGEVDGSVIASVMAGYEGHRGWVNYLAVDPLYQGRGLGRQILHDAEARLLACGCPKINLMVRSTNAQVIGFYERLGYVKDEVTCLGKRLISDEPT